MSKGPKKQWGAHLQPARNGPKALKHSLTDAELARIKAERQKRLVYMERRRQENEKAAAEARAKEQWKLTVNWGSL